MINEFDDLTKIKILTNINEKEKEIQEALNVLKAYSKHINIWLYNDKIDDTKTFIIDKNTEIGFYSNIKVEDNKLKFYK